MTKYALLIGCNYYKTDCVLPGSMNNITNIHNMLIEHLGYSSKNVVSLRDDSDATGLLPTRYNITTQLLYLISLTPIASEIFIYYSGHGSRVADNTIFGDGNGFDSCITPVDFMTYGCITNNELYGILCLSSCPTFILADCCYSGTLCDLPFSYEYIEDTIKLTRTNGRPMLNTQIVMMSACENTEFGYQFYDNAESEFVGSLTDAFLHCLSNHAYAVDIQAIFIDIYTFLPTCNLPKQHPVLSCSSNSPKWAFFDIEPLPVLPPVQPADTSKCVGRKNDTCCKIC